MPHRLPCVECVGDVEYVPKFNIRGSNAADYKRTDVECDVLFVFG